MNRPVKHIPLIFIGLVCLFVCSRFFFLCTGIQFQTDPLFSWWQMLDLKLLQSDLLQSIVYLHNQPPLFNFMIGIIVKSFPQSYPAALYLQYLLTGLLTCLILYRTALHLTRSRLTGIVLACFFIFTPASILYENYASYTYPTLFLTLLSVLCLIESFNRPSGVRILVFFLSMSALTLIRTAFHPVWFLVVFIVLYQSMPASRKRILASALISIFPMVVWCGKNFVIFDIPHCSSWLGMSLCQTTLFQLDEDIRTRLVKSGSLSPISKIPPFSPLAEYENLIEQSAERGIPAVDRKTKSYGNRNYNHRDYAIVSKIYLRDSLYVLRHHPWVLLRTMLYTSCTYFLPANDSVLLRRPVSRIAGYEKWFSRIFYGQLFRESRAANISKMTLTDLLRRYRHCGFWLIILYPVAIAHGIRQTLPASQNCLERRLLFFYLTFTLSFTSAAGICTVLYDQNRYRFLTEPLFLLLLGSFIGSFLDRASADPNRHN
ncbi:phospholipid carrier-dependent glycosyltransferase [bacterium]|nr:phospholipid carrier-dependent glycosyltransferase [candidate division CSSED10-310 bacterium]